MSVVWLILKILGMTLAGALALLLVALLIPAVVEISYSQKKMNVTLRYLFMPFRLVEADVVKVKKGGENGTDDTLEVDLKAKTKKGRQKEKIKLDVGMILALLKPGGRAVWYVTRRLKIYDICIRTIAHGRDCAAVGIAAGHRWAAIGMLADAVNGVWPKAKYAELTVIPDFAGEFAEGEKHSCKIAALPIIIIIAGLGFLIKYFNITSEREKEKIARETQAAIAVETT